MNATKWFIAEQSNAYGFVHAVTTALLPGGSELTVIEEDGTVHAYPAAALLCPTYLV